MNFATSFPGFKLRLTRWGGIFLLLALVLGFAAVNTGNNALMATLGLALASYAVSGAWSRQVLARADVAVHMPPEIYAGRPALVEVELRNTSWLFPAYGLVLRDGDGRLLHVEPTVPRTASRRRVVEVGFADRGWASLDEWRVEVLLPLGFFLKSKKVLVGRKVLVYPRILSGSSVEARTGHSELRSEYWKERGREGEITQLREYRDGDELRQLHWKQTARQQRLIAMDRERPAEAPVIFVLDPRVDDPDDPELRARFEALVSEVATAVVRRLERGSAVGVAVGSVSVGPVRLRHEIGSLLRPLAEVQPLAADAEIVVPRTREQVVVVKA